MALDPVLLVGLRAIGPYLDDVVVGGGWVPYLYSVYQPPAAAAVRLATRDIDVAVARSLAQREKSLNQLLTEADFRCEFRSRGIPPVTLYVASRGNEEIEIEFITSAQGPSEGVRTVQSGLTAQELRYVDLLLANKWSLPLDSLTDGELDGQVWVPNPGAFVLHKGLVYERRSDPLKKEKDLYYIFYVLDGFGVWHEWIRSDMARLAKSAPRWFRRCRSDLEAAFATPESPGVDAILNQRPGTAYPGLDDDQFRQYGWTVMQDLLEMMRGAMATD